MKKLLASAVALAVLLVVPAVAPAANGPKNTDNDTHIQLLAINDLHGHLAPNTPGTIQTGCCTAVTNSSGVTSWTQNPVPAGGVEYLSTHLKSLRLTNANTLSVGAGDLIGASPLVSGLFHDEPTIEALNAMQFDINGVGNHEFDEGLDELLRMQYGNQNGGDGCHPDDGCQDGTPFVGSVFQYLAANVFYAGTNDTVLPAYEVRKVGNTKIAFIGLTLEGTPLIVSSEAVEGLEFRAEVATTNALVEKLRNEQGVRAFVVLLHQGGQQNPPSQPAWPAPANPEAYTDVNRCVNFSGTELIDITKRLDPRVSVVISGHSHQPYVCPNLEGSGKLVTSASSFGRVITDIDLVIDHQSKTVTSAVATNRIVTQDNPATLVVEVAKDPALTAIVDKYTILAAPLANRVVGKITADILSQRTTGGATAAGESSMGDIIADSQLESTAEESHGGAVVAFMNPGGIRADLTYAKNYSGLATELPGDVTYGEIFDVQPFGNSLVTKTMTGANIHALLEQQFSTSSATTRTILQVSNGFTYSWYRNAAGQHVRVGGKVVVPNSIKLDGVEIPADGTTYRVTMNSFLATGGDGFSVFNLGTEQQGGEIDLDALGRYIGLHSPLAPTPRNRITTTAPPA